MSRSVGKHGNLSQNHCNDLASGAESGSSKSEYGENLYKTWGSSSVGVGEEAVRRWYEQEELYDYDNPTPSDDATAQFTQVIFSAYQLSIQSLIEMLQFNLANLN